MGTSRPVRRKNPEGHQGWGDLPVSAWEHPIVRLIQTIALALILILALGRLGVLKDRPVPVDVVRINETTTARLSTAVAHHAHGGNVRTVILVNETATVDAVAAAGLAASLDASLVLSPPDKIDNEVRDLFRSSRTDQVYLIGDEEALSHEIKTSVEAMGIAVTRLAGASEAETAVVVAQTARAQATAENDHVIVVPADNADAALLAAPLAANRTSPAPVLFSSGGSFPDVTITAIAEFEATRLTVFGELESTVNGESQTLDSVESVAEAIAESQRFPAPRIVIVPDGDPVRYVLAATLAGNDSGVVLPYSTAEAWITASCGSFDELIVVAPTETILDEDVDRLYVAGSTCDD